MCVQLTWWVCIQISLAVHANGNHVSLHKAHKNALVQIPMNPSLPGPSDSIYSREQTGPKPCSLKVRRDRPTWIQLSVALSFSMIWHQRIRSTVVQHVGWGWPTRSINLFPSISLLLFSLSSPLLSSFYLLFLCKRPQKADFGRDPSGVKRQKVEKKVDGLGKMVDKYKWSQHQPGEWLSVTSHGNAENSNTNVWWFHSWSKCSKLLCN